MRQIGTDNFNDLGVGPREIGVAGGDSGTPGLINSDLASINSYGLSFGTRFCDLVAGLNTSFGEYSGYVPVYIHQEFIAQSTAIPEPASWSKLITCFGLIGATIRRRRAAVA